MIAMGVGLAFIWQGARAMRVSGALAGAGRFTLIPVEIDEVEEAGKGTKVTLRNPASRRPKATFASLFDANEEPLILPNADG